jgi:hypothetical protein
VKKLTPAPTVLYFYCQHGNGERDNFLQLARSLLAQFLQQDKDLLLYFYEKCCSSGTASLSTPGEVEELLQFAFDSCKSAYIVLDGLDECSRDERKRITQRFRKLVEDLPTTEPERLRCLFVSQDDGVARKDFSGLASIKIKKEDNQSDIDKYCRLNAAKLKEFFPLTDGDVDVVADKVAESVDGMAPVPIMPCHTSSYPYQACSYSQNLFGSTYMLRVTRKNCGES